MTKEYPAFDLYHPVFTLLPVLPYSIWRNTRYFVIEALSGQNALKIHFRKRKAEKIVRMLNRYFEIPESKPQYRRVKGVIRAFALAVVLLGATGASGQALPGMPWVPGQRGSPLPSPLDPTWGRIYYPNQGSGRPAANVTPLQTLCRTAGGNLMLPDGRLYNEKPMEFSSAQREAIPQCEWPK